MGKEEGATFGRSSNNAVPLKDSKVSRLHLRIDRDNEYVFLVVVVEVLYGNVQLNATLHSGKVTAYDLGSKAGSFVNGKRFEAVALRLGDKIRIGNTLIIIRGSKPKRKSIMKRMSDWMFK